MVLTISTIAAGFVGGERFSSQAARSVFIVQDGKNILQDGKKQQIRRAPRVVMTRREVWPGAVMLP